MPEPSRATRLNRAFWDAIADEYQRDMGRDLAGDVVWGPSCPPESQLRLLGDVADRDVLDLGCGGGQTSVHLAKRGARVTGVDASGAQLRHARALAAREQVDVRFVEASLDALPMLDDASFDLILSAYVMGYVEDIGRAFREAARLLRPGGRFVFSWASPLFEQTALTEEGMLLVARPYWMTQPQESHEDAGVLVEFPRTYGDWLRALVGAGLVVQDLVEPAPLPVESAWSATHPLAKLQMVPGTSVWVAGKPAQKQT